MLSTGSERGSFWTSRFIPPFSGSGDGCSFPALAAVLFFAAVLSGCGGGSSVRQASGPGFDQALAELASPETVASAADNTPKRGSITQSSDGDASRVTEDAVEVEITTSSGTVQYELTYNTKTLVDTTDDDSEESDAVEKSIVSGDGIPDEGTYLYQRLADNEDEDGSYAVAFYRKLTEAEAQDLGLSTTGGGNLWVAVHTRQTGSNNTDYLSAGVWVYSPDADSEDQEYGVFADGSDPFMQSNLAGLTGTAVYKGDAGGIYADGENDKNYYFAAKSELTANFDDDSMLGRIYNIVVGGKNIGAAMTLKSTPITDTEGGFFAGDTSISIGGFEHTGKWGGQFYGNDDTDPTAHPASVLGTFGATNEESSISILGTFEAHKQP